MIRKIHTILQGLNIIDLVGTYYFVIYKQTWTEINIVPAYLIAEFGVWGLIFGKVLTAYVLWRILYQRRKHVKVQK